MTVYFADLKEMATGIVDKWMKKIRGDSGGSKDSNGGTYEKGISRNTAMHYFFVNTNEKVLTNSMLPSILLLLFYCPELTIYCRPVHRYRGIWVFNFPDTENVGNLP